MGMMRRKVRIIAHKSIFDDDEDDDWMLQEQELGREERAALKKAKEDFESSGREALDRCLDEMLQHPSVGVAHQQYDVSAWMTEEERRCIEWFDHDDADTFMKRSAWYDGDGWIIPYYRAICDEMHLASKKALEDYALDYHVKHDRVRGRPNTPWPEVSRSERLVRAVERLVAAVEAGDPRAMNVIGTFCAQGVPRCVQTALYDFPVFRCGGQVKARAWFRKSAEGGCVQGQRNYARMLNEGLGAEVYEEDEENDDDDDAAIEAAVARMKLRARKDREKAFALYLDLALRGDGKSQHRVACLYASGGVVARNIPECAKWLRIAAQNGNKQAMAVVSASGRDMSDERLFAELLISWQEARWRETREANPREDDDFSIAYSIPVRPEAKGTPEEQKDRELKDAAGLLKDKPDGTVLPPPAGRESVRIPNLQSANPSFAARLIILVRDRFGGDAPAIYGAAHVSRKTYSSIVSNELRPVSKQTAIAFALALRLPLKEAAELLESAGFSLSQFYLEDIIVKSCITAGIYEIDRVNAILAAHGAKTMPA